MRKPNTLNVRVHLEHFNMIMEGLSKYGMCPLVEEELKKFHFYNKAILRKHATRKTRKDLYVNTA